MHAARSAALSRGNPLHRNAPARSFGQREAGALSRPSSARSPTRGPGAASALARAQARHPPDPRRAISRARLHRAPAPRPARVGIPSSVWTPIGLVQGTRPQVRARPPATQGRRRPRPSPIRRAGSRRVIGSLRPVVPPCAGRKSALVRPAAARAQGHVGSGACTRARFPGGAGWGPSAQAGRPPCWAPLRRNAMPATLGSATPVPAFSREARAWPKRCVPSEPCGLGRMSGLWARASVCVGTAWFALCRGMAVL